VKARIVGLALGTIHRMDGSLAADRDGNRNGLVDLARRYPIRGVEITLGSLAQVRNLELSEENRRWLRSLDYVSIHGPLFGNGAGRGGSEGATLEKLERIYADCGAANIVLHPDRLPDASWMRETPCSLSIENLAASATADGERLGAVLSEFPKAGFCLDLSHAESGSAGEAGALISRFGHRLRQVHVSAAHGDLTHLRMRHASRGLRAAFHHLRVLGIPCLLEEDLADAVEVEEDLAILSSLLR